jgi:hypothetical protein
VEYNLGRKMANKKEKYLVTITNQEDENIVFNFSCPAFQIKSDTFDGKKVKTMNFEFYEVLDVLEKHSLKEFREKMK